MVWLNGYLAIVVDCLIYYFDEVLFAPFENQQYFFYSRVDDGLSIKLADMGTVKEVPHTSYYKPASMKGLPIRWMAPECLRSHRFSVKSDVVRMERAIFTLCTLNIYTVTTVALIYSTKWSLRSSLLNLSKLGNLTVSNIDKSLQTTINRQTHLFLCQQVEPRQLAIIDCSLGIVLSLV